MAEEIKRHKSNEVVPTEEFYADNKEYLTVAHPVEISEEELYEYDKSSGHLFCKYCGRNYLAKEHNEDCQSIKDEEQPEGYTAPFTIIDETVEGID